MRNVQQQTRTVLDEDDELFIGYGFLDSSFPYRLQDCYGRDLKDTPVQTAVLENARLKAVFLPEWGGRLWSLYDKDAGRELTYANPVIRPCNLAFRNAWLAGGVEWNCGMVGHHPYTCSPMHTARLYLDDGTPVLRMYQFERIRRAVWQMDFFLPEDSRFLYARMRIVNPNTEVVPMYWWSNIAVPEYKGARVIMDTDETYTNRDNMVSKTTVPFSGGVDITYPVNNPHAIDFFWKIPPENRKFVCQLDRGGYGLMQTSTRRLKGRKLFVWGQGPGGDRWQEFLTLEGTGGRYAEIQAGLAHTQYECLPMPPKTAWEWLEAYGPLQADSQLIHEDWQEARREVSSCLERALPEQSLEVLLKKTRNMALRPAEEILLHGGGWGALEKKRRKVQGEEDFCPHLDFGPLEAEQEDWDFLLQNGCFPETHSPADVPSSWMLQKQWTGMLEQSAAGAGRFQWSVWLQLGMIAFVQRRMEDAEKALARSMELQPSCWALYGLSQIARYQGDLQSAAMLAWKACHMKPSDLSLAKEALRLLQDAGLYERSLSLIADLPAESRENGRVKLYQGFALLHTGRMQEAEDILTGKGGIVVPDVREGENTVTELWYQIQEAKAAHAGQSFDRASAVPPASLDFRMAAAPRK